MGDGQTGSGGRVAVIDLGSNSFHLLVAAPRGLERVHTRKIMLRLGDLVARNGALGADGAARADDALARLLDDARARHAERVIVVATDALRRASDGGRWRERMLERHGVEIRLLTGDEEATLSLSGMLTALGIDEPVLGLDLGGGSFEVAFGGPGQTSGQTPGQTPGQAPGQAVASVSLPMGSATVSAGFRHDPPRLAERAHVHEQVLARLRPLSARLAGAGATPVRAVGTAGTIRDLARVALALDGQSVPRHIRGVMVTRTQLERAYARLVSVPTAQRLALPGVGKKRADLLPGGGMVLLATLEAFGLEHLQLCDWGLREGVLVDALGDASVVAAGDFAALTRPADHRAG